MFTNISKIENEKLTVEKMIEFYCSKHHHDKSTTSPCSECSSLIEYAHMKLDRCICGEKKPPCNKCSIHCYNNEMRNKIKSVMRYSGLRIIYVHPVLAIKYLINKIGIYCIIQIVNLYK